MTSKDKRFLILGEITYVSRRSDKDFDTHWQLLKGGKSERLENNEGDAIIISITVWHKTTEPHLRDQFHWNSWDDAVNYLKTFCERVA